MTCLKLFFHAEQNWVSYVREETNMSELENNKVAR